MFVKSCWYVAAWSHEIGPEDLFTRTICDEAVLLMRTEGGRVVAMDNRCCHRGAPLDKGRREGDCVRCGYHGLKFDASGMCVEIPGQDRIPPQARVRTYPVIEKNKWVFVWMGDPAKADPALLPDNFANDDPGYRYKPEYIWYDTDYLLIADNLLDFSHLSYVHEATLGGSTQIAQSKPTIERLARGLRVTRLVSDVPPAPYHRAFGEFADNVDRWFIYDFVLPGILSMHSGVKPRDREWGDYEGSLQLKSCQALTPETATSTHYFFMQAHGFALDDEALTENIRKSVVQAFEEDRQIIRSQQKMLQMGPMPFLPIAADAALNYFRALVTRLSQEEKDAETAARAPSNVAGVKVHMASEVLAK